MLAWLAPPPSHVVCYVGPIKAVLMPGTGYLSEHASDSKQATAIHNLGGTMHTLKLHHPSHRILPMAAAISASAHLQKICRHMLFQILATCETNVSQAGRSR